MCYYASENRRILPAKEFYNADLCQAANLETEYNIWMDRQRPATAAAGRVTLRSLCDYSFIMTPKVKNEILKEAAADQKRSHEFLTSSGDNDPYTNRPNSQPIHYCPYCIIKVEALYLKVFFFLMRLILPSPLMDGWMDEQLAVMDTGSPKEYLE